MSTSEPPGAARAKCPICRRQAEAAYRPFCSRRCADVDLSRWLRGAYAIPDAPESEDGNGARAAGDVGQREGDGGNGKG
jgi:endogenous inhibitor of DNA gyrase (YacG/DUF329 family)